jgi:VWFA-related protein
MLSRMFPCAVVSALTAVAPGGVLAQPTPPEEIPEFAVGTELVRIDVVVTGEEGRLVSDLDRGDFAVFEDDEPQEIVHFEAYVHGQAVLPPEEGGPRGTASGEEVEGYRRRHIVFAVDDLHIEPGHLSAAKTAMMHFVEEQLEPEDRVAVVATSGSLGLFQEFSNDEEVLDRAILRLAPQPVRPRWVGTPQISDYQAELIERGDPLALEMAVQDILRELPPGADPEAAARQVMTRARGIRAESSHFVRSTLETLESVMRSLARLPGRKVVVLVSDGFLMGLGTTHSRAFDVRRIVDAGTRAGVVLYGLDTRGLVSASPLGGADQAGIPSQDAPGLREGMTQQATEAVRDGMTALARDTGGFLVHGTNDVGAGLDRILRDTQTYYLLSYQPTNTRRDGRFRKIEIRLPGRQSLRTRTRRGYFAADAKGDDGPAEPGPSEAGHQGAENLRRALASLYPRTEIPTRLAVDFVSMGRAGLQVVVNGHVDLSAVAFQEAGDRQEAALVVAGVVFDEAGSLFARLEPERAGLSLDGPDYQQARRAGLTYERTLALNPGAYEVRLAVLEEGTGRLGSASRRIDVPDPEGGSLTLSGVFLLRAGAASPDGTPPPGPAVPLRNVQAHPTFERTDSLYYQIQVLNAERDESDQARLTIQAHVFEGDRLLASTREQPLALASLGPVPDAYTGRITLGPLGEGEYELRVVVTDHVAKKAVSGHAAFTVVEP